MALILCHAEIMPSTLNVTPKKRGRPATGKQPQVSIRMSADLLLALDAWIEDQPEPKPNRSEAIRLIVSTVLFEAS